MAKQLSQSQIVHGVFETLATTVMPVTVSLDEIMFLNPYSTSLMEERLERNEIHSRLRQAIEKVITDNPTRKSLLVAIYDAMEIKPGVSGVSVNIKQIIECMVPDIREKLSHIKFRKHSLRPLRFLITPAGTRSVVSSEMCKERLGEKLFNSLKAAGLIREYTRNKTQWVELSHDMMIQSIQQK
jgi:hypothetical protein